MQPASVVEVNTVMDAMDGWSLPLFQTFEGKKGVTIQRTLDRITPTGIMCCTVACLDGCRNDTFMVERMRKPVCFLV